MNFIIDVFKLCLFCLENKFYYPELFKGSTSIFTLLYRFKISLSDMREMNENYNSMSNKPIDYIIENSKIFNFSLGESKPEDKLESFTRLSQLIKEDLIENKPYHINIISKGDLLRADGNILHFGSIYIRTGINGVDSDQYKAKLINKMHSHL